MVYREEVKKRAPKRTGKENLKDSLEQMIMSLDDVSYKVENHFDYGRELRRDQLLSYLSHFRFNLELFLSSIGATMEEVEATSLEAYPNAKENQQK